MSSTYMLLNFSFMTMAAGLCYKLRDYLPTWRQLGKMALLLLPAMLIFDSYLTTLPIVTYESNRILGVYIGNIPVEDFSYLMVVLVLAPALLRYFVKKEKSSSNT